MRLLNVALFALMAAGQDIHFINPTPQDLSNKDSSTYPVFALGSTVVLQWSAPPSQSLNMVLYPEGKNVNATLELVFGRFCLLCMEGRCNSNEADFDVSVAQTANIVSYFWTVQTTKDLAVSNIFYLEIFKTGDIYPAAISHYFKIIVPTSSTTTFSTIATSSSTSATISIRYSTPASIVSPISSTLAVSSTSAATDGTAATTSSTFISTNSVATNSTSSSIGITQTVKSTNAVTDAVATTKSSIDTPSGLALGSRIGLGLGIPIVVIMLSLAGWYLHQRQRKRGTDTAARLNLDMVEPRAPHGWAQFGHVGTASS